MFLMVPGIIAGGVSQINMLVDTILASLLPTGSPSWLYVSDRLMQLPLGIFAIAIATVILPRLSNLFASENKEQFSSTLDWSMRLIFLIGVPAVIGLVMLAEPIILTLFERGEFRSVDSSMASSSLVALAFGLLAFMLIKILTPSFFARQQPKKPMYVALASMILNAFLAWLLAFHLGYAHVGLALPVQSLLSLPLLLFYLSYTKTMFTMLQRAGLFSYSRCHWPLWCSSFLLYYFGKEVDYLRQIGEFSRFLYIIKIILIGMFGYFLSLWILGLRIKDFSSKDVFD